MSDRFFFLDEPMLSFGAEQEADDPRDGLALFGPSEQKDARTDYVAIGTPVGLEAWSAWVDALNRPSACLDVSRHRPWPPYPGFDVVP
jgi:hypothetical protein